VSSEDQLIRRAARRARRELGRVARKAGVRRDPAPIRYGPKPTVEVEQTNLGPVMDELVARMRRNQRALRVNEDYDLVREHFDHYHFLLQATALQELHGIDPIRVFLRNGAEATNSPDINFSMRSYLRRYPEHAEGPERSPYLEWLKRGRAAGEIADPAPGVESMAGVLGMEPLELVDLLTQRRNDLQHRLRYGVLGEMFAKAAEIEPLVGEAWVETTMPKLSPLTSLTAVEQVAAIKGCQEAAGYRRARVVIVTDEPRRGGGRRPEGHLAHALATRVAPSDLVVIYTDAPGVGAPGRFPAGVREIDFATRAESVPPAHRPQALVALLRSFHAEAIVNVDSRVLYQALTPYGRALAASERIFLCFTDTHQTAQGTWTGWSLKHLYRCFDVVEGVITDSFSFRDWLSDQYVLDDEERAMVHALPAPVLADVGVVAGPAPQGRRPQVYWSGRWDHESRAEVVLELARRMPEVDFRLWGEPVGPAQTPHEAGGEAPSVALANAPGDVPQNAHLVTGYVRTDELPLGEADIWLHTSSWPGVPGDLLDVAMTGVPIVAGATRGVGEVVSDEDAWLVAEPESIDAYEKTLREALTDSSTAWQRSRALRERLLRERPAEAYAERVVGLILPATTEQS